MKFSKILVIAFFLIGCMNAFGQKNESKLEIGTYKATAQETIVESRFGLTRSATTTNLQIKIKSVNSDGSVKAEVIVAGSLPRKGNLSGKLNSSGKLELNGGLIGSNNAVHKTKLTATVDDTGSLTDGKYVSSDGFFKVTGDFELGVFVEDDD